MVKHQIVPYDWGQGPHCMAQKRNEFRARRLKQIRNRNKRYAMAARLGMMLRLPAATDVEDLALFAAIFIAPLFLMGLICGPDIIP